LAWVSRQEPERLTAVAAAVAALQLQEPNDR
jgi:hypothetical protein